jgi:hypothetical protein
VEEKRRNWASFRDGSSVPVIVQGVRLSWPIVDFQHPALLQLTGNKGQKHALQDRSSTKYVSPLDADRQALPNYPRTSWKFCINLAV